MSLATLSAYAVLVKIVLLWLYSLLTRIAISHCKGNAVCKYGRTQLNLFPDILVIEVAFEKRIGVETRILIVGWTTFVG